MPEGIEVEYYRQTALRALNREIRLVGTVDQNYLRDGHSLIDIKNLLEGNTFEFANRRGKLLVLSVSNGLSIGLRFGMTGRLLVDGVSAIETLEYSSTKNEPKWDRFSLKFSDGGTLSIRDPRRLGAVQINPDIEILGVDLYEVTIPSLLKALGGSSRALKTCLMDQSKIAGLGNLLTDEILWRSSIDPRRAANSLAYDEQKRLAYHIRQTVKQLTKLGGSHTGKLQAHRVTGGLCPKDGEPLERYTIGGRTTYSCPLHQI